MLPVLRSKNSITMKNTTFLSLTAVLYCLFFANPASAQSWSLLNSGTDRHLRDIYFLDDSYGVAVGDTGTVLLTTNGGTTWSQLNLETKKTVASVLVLGVDTFLVAAGDYFDGDIYRTTDSGNQWERVDGAIELAENVSSFFALNSKGILHSQDRGLTWQPTDISIGSTTLLAELSFPDKSTGYAMGLVSGFATYSAYGYRSIDGGLSWLPLFEQDFPNADAWTASFFPNADLGFVFTNQFVNFLPGTNNKLVKINNFYFDNRPGLFVWRFDAEVVNDKMPTYINDAAFLDDQEGFAVGENGAIYKTTNGGADWTEDYTGENPLKSIFILEKNIGYVVGENGTILKYNFSTSTKEPKQIKVLQLYPNPAQGTVRFEGLEALHGRLSIYNAQGQALRSITLNGENVVALGDLTTGFYLVEIRSDGQVYQGKLIVQH